MSSMCRQEEFVVAIVSAMQASENDGGAYDPTRKFHYGLSSNNIVVNGQQQKVVTLECRARMLNWCLDVSISLTIDDICVCCSVYSNSNPIYIFFFGIQMMDFFEIDRSIVAIAMYYQDRYLGTEKGRAARTNRSIFRIVSVTSLYMALKLSQPGNRWNITSHAFAKLCQGAVLGDEINDMEIDILFALDWYVNPPTPMKYAEALLELIFNGSSSSSSSGSSSCTREDYFVTKNPLLCDEEDTTTSKSLPPQELREQVRELISYQLEVALHDKRLFQIRSSAIGTAAVVNALKGIQYESSTSCSASFCEESIDTVLDMMTTCNLVSSEECLEEIRSVLLNSVVSPASNNDEGSSQEDDTDTDQDALSSNITRAETPPPQQRKVRTPPVSSSPTSVFQVLLRSSYRS